MKPFLTKFAVCALPALLIFQLAGARLARAQSSEEDVNLCRQTAGAYLDEAQQTLTKNGEALTPDEMTKIKDVIESYCKRFPTSVVQELQANHEKIKSVTKLTFAPYL